MLNPLPAPPRAHPHSGGDPRVARGQPPPSIVIEFRPLLATQARTGMNRALAVAACGVLMLVALAAVLTRKALRRALLDEQLERQRRLASLGQDAIREASDKVE